MRASINVRIDAQADRCLNAHGPSNVIKHFKLWFRFHIELKNSCLKPGTKFYGCFANTGKHNLLRRDTGFKGATKFAL